MRLLIYTGCQQTAVAVAASIPGARVVVKGDVFADVMADFRSRPSAVLVCGSGTLTQGWAAPEETIVLFAGDFPEDPALRHQALARVGRPRQLRLDGGDHGGWSV